MTDIISDDAGNIIEVTLDEKLQISAEETPEVDVSTEEVEGAPPLTPEEIKERLAQEVFKLVVTSTVWENHGTQEDALWKPVAAQEYIAAYFQGEPTFEMIYENLQKVHELFDSDSNYMVETVAGYQVYFLQAPTNSEFFQIERNGSIDFPPIDLTLVGLSEQELEEELKRRRGEVVEDSAESTEETPTGEVETTA